MPTRVKSQALSDLLFICPQALKDEMTEEIPGEVGNCEKETKEGWWIAMFDGTPANVAGGAWIVLVTLEGTQMSFVYKLKFSTTNNKAEYEALILGLMMANEVKVKRLRIKGDSNLIIKKVEGRYRVKEVYLALYRDEARRLIEGFEEVEITHIPRAKNRYADTLETIGSKASGIREFLEDGVLPATTQDVERVKTRATCYFLEQKQLFKRTWTGEVLRYVKEEEQETVMTEVHKGVCGRHQGGRSLWGELTKLGYYWPIIRDNAKRFSLKCVQCQKHWNLICAPTRSLHGMTSPYPFQNWAMDFIGLINPASKGKKWILVAMKHFTKWVKAIAVKEAKADTVVTFIKENIVCRFRLPQRIVSDNGTHFINSKVIKKDPRKVQNPPWEFHTILSTIQWTGGVHQQNLNIIADKNEAVLPAEVVVSFPQMLLGGEAKRTTELEDVENLCDKVKEEALKHHRRLVLAYEKLVRPRMFNEGELVMKATNAVMRGQHTSKWAPKWEGPYMV
ncbi:Ribonuclease H domain [Sesbania bispinosa]|nr:Ribonuclease H domain [Sesbania bispinosa]